MTPLAHLVYLEGVDPVFFGTDADFAKWKALQG